MHTNIALCPVCAVERSFLPGEGSPDRFCSADCADRHQAFLGDAVGAYLLPADRRAALAVHGDTSDIVGDDLAEDLYDEYDSPEVEDEYS